MTEPASLFGSVIGRRPQGVLNPAPPWFATFSLRIVQKDWFEFVAWRGARRGPAIADTITPQGSLQTGFPALITFNGGVPFTDGVGWSVGGPRITTRLAAHQFALEITVTRPDQFRLGRFFWLGEYMYRTVTITDDVIGIEPPLREAVPVITPISFTGTLEMYLAGNEVPEAQRTPDGYTDLTVQLVEKFPDA